MKSCLRLCEVSRSLHHSCKNGWTAVIDRRENGAKDKCRIEYGEGESRSGWKWFFLFFHLKIKSELLEISLILDGSWPACVIGSINSRKWKRNCIKTRDCLSVIGWKHAAIILLSLPPPSKTIPTWKRIPIIPCCFLCKCLRYSIPFLSFVFNIRPECLVEFSRWVLATVWKIDTFFKIT